MLSALHSIIGCGNLALEKCKRPIFYRTGSCVSVKSQHSTLVAEVAELTSTATLEATSTIHCGRLSLLLQDCHELNSTVFSRSARETAEFDSSNGDIT